MVDPFFFAINAVLAGTAWTGAGAMLFKFAKGRLELKWIGRLGAATLGLFAVLVSASAVAH